MPVLPVELVLGGVTGVLDDEPLDEPLAAVAPELGEEPLLEVVGALDEEPLEDATAALDKEPLEDVAPALGEDPGPDVVTAAGVPTGCAVPVLLALLPLHPASASNAALLVSATVSDTKFPSDEFRCINLILRFVLRANYAHRETSGTACLPAETVSGVRLSAPPSSVRV